MNKFTGLIFIVLVAVAAVTIYNSIQPNHWRAFYQEATVMGPIAGREFTDRNACVRWINEERIKETGKTDYECGRDCTPPASKYSAWKCAETVN